MSLGKLDYVHFRLYGVCIQGDVAILRMEILWACGYQLPTSGAYWELFSYREIRQYYLSKGLWMEEQKALSVLVKVVDVLNCPEKL